ncbi:monovalent cation/H+ antiporter subunit D [Melaminivora suipulveris]|uniref:Monovalent cation/H+ antiporter subunit D n=2 Tax=Melaminivora suipulveris TaxID=2109913 RepID=A0A2R3QGK2_9BURK|nr:monovalent cation/H+ antiporter subunit D [Melaminivora suipulveris]
MPHLMLAPVALPLFTAMLTLLMREERQRVKLGLNIVSTALGLLVAVALLRWAHHSAGATGMGVYLEGNWAAPFGIVLVLDRLSALMLVLTSAIALCAVVFAGTRWHRAGVHFHTLYQLQLMGLAGAFLTGDLFNLFVFFEIMLAASYGLLLHGSGRARVQSGLHYIAINLAASSLFLIGASMLYGITGTLNMADLARSVPLVAPQDLGLLHAAAAILATAFLIKAAVWPLNFWLVPAYSAATAPVGALFAIMTKVGVYTLLRLWTLMFGSEAGASALFGGPWLIAAGMATMAFGGIGIMASQRPVQLACFAALLSSGTVLAASGFGQNSLTAAMLYYLPGSTMGIAALFLLADLIERWRTDGTALRADDGDEAPFLTPELVPRPGLNLDDDEEVLVGQAIPAAAALLGLGWLVCALVIAGMPPLSGFVGKFAMLTALLNPLGLGSSAGAQPGVAGWALLTLLIATGLLSLLALTRAGMRNFWAASERAAPRLHVLEGLPVAALLLACVALTLRAEPALRFTEAASNSLHAPETYIRAVLDARPLPGPASAADDPAIPQARRP